MKKYRIINNLIPFIPTPPGRIVKRGLEELGMSNVQAAQNLKIPLFQLEALLNGETPLTESIAEGLVKLVGGRKEFWLGLEADYVSHPKFAGWGGSRTGSGRKKLGLSSKQIRLSAKPDEMQQIEVWLKHQKNAGQIVAKLILEQTKIQASGRTKHP
jgi:plasmid maintenance system antidote protein VapI